MKKYQESQAQWSQPGRVDGGMVPLALSFVAGRKTTCMVMTHPGISPKITLESASVLLFSKILPAFINLRSFIVFGPFCFSAQTTQFYLSISLARKRYPFKSSLWKKNIKMVVYTPFGQWLRILSLMLATVVAGAYLFGPMSVPSYKRNLSSTGSSKDITDIPCTPATLILTIANLLTISPNTDV